MQNSKLFAFLKTFQKRDFRRFKEYLASPFHNKRKDLRDFYAVLLKWAPGFDAHDLTRETIWAHYAPGKPMDEKSLTYLMNFLLKHAEQYVAIEAFDTDAAAKGNRILNYCLENSLDKHYRAAYQQTRKSLEGEPYRDGEWHLKAWRLAYMEMQQFYRSQSRKTDDSIQRVLEHLDAFYFDRKLELSSEIINLNQILQTDYDASFIPDLLALVEKKSKNKPAVEIRRLVLNLHHHPEDMNSFHLLQELLPTASRYFPPEKVKGIFAYVQNYCIRKIKSGEIAFENELFGLYQQSIQAGVIYEEGLINPWDFKNICSISLKLKAYEWTKNFIESHQRRLATQFRSTSVAYNQANLLFHQGQFDLALKSLMKVEFSDVFYALDTRRMMLMIYYERGDSEALLSLVASFRTYLKRNRVISEQNRKAYKNFVDWVARLFRTGTLSDQARAKTLREIKETDPIADRDWLINKL